MKKSLFVFAVIASSVAASGCGKLVTSSTTASTASKPVVLAKGTPIKPAPVAKPATDSAKPTVTAAPKAALPLASSGSVPAAAPSSTTPTVAASNPNNLFIGTWSTD